MLLLILYCGFGLVRILYFIKYSKLSFSQIPPSWSVTPQIIRAHMLGKAFFNLVMLSMWEQFEE